MSKMKQIAALTAMLVGVILYASPAKSAVCFLPDDDGSCGGGDIEISPNPTPVDQCTDFKLSKNQRDSKEYSSDCYTCESCTYNNRTTYKCSPKSGATWYGNLGVCCTNGETYDSAEGECCPAGGCTHECDAPKKWSTTLRRCECPNGKETSTGTCCTDEEHVDGTICCPEKKHNDGGKCVCDSQYNTDKDGNCVLPVGCTYEYRQATIQDSCGSTSVIGEHSCQYYTLSRLSSVYLNSPEENVINGVINKISNESATCVDDKKVTKYQTICEGIPESLADCKYPEVFIPNGCVSDSYNNGFAVDGDRFGSCGIDPNCSYEYTHLTYSDIGTNDVNGKTLRYGQEDTVCDKEGATRSNYCMKYNQGYTCGIGGSSCNKSQYGKSCTQICRYYNNCPITTTCYDKMYGKSSILTEGHGTPEWGTIYNKISNQSASCTALDGKVRYETICPGKPKQQCPSPKVFIPNNCESASYNVGTSSGFEVVGAEYGDCICDTSKKMYDTAEICRNTTSLNCTYSDGCYQTCESAGMYSTKEACEKGLASGYICLENSNSNCYIRHLNGFIIQLDNSQKTSFQCKYDSSGYVYQVKLGAFLQDSNQQAPYDSSGNFGGEIYKSARIFPAGTYYICGKVDKAGILVSSTSVQNAAHGSAMCCALAMIIPLAVKKLNIQEMDILVIHLLSKKALLITLV